MIDMSWMEAKTTTDDGTQGTHSWREWRGKGLGSSDAPVLMGVSPWKTLHTLWREKTGDPTLEEFKGNWATARGTKLEPLARIKYERMVQAKYPPDQMTHPTHNTFRASFDGINWEHRRVLEIKCPGKVDHATAMTGRVPDKYIPQCQWLMMVAGLMDLDYVSWSGEPDHDIVIVPVKADAAMWKEMEERALAFWALVQSNTPPPVDDRSVDLSDDAELDTDLVEYNGLLRRSKEIAAEMDILMTRIRAKAVESESRCGGYRLVWTEKKGVVDYMSVPWIKGADLEAFRKKPTRSFSIKEAK